jgi:hypothetical protein
MESSNKVKLEINVTGFYFNKWPDLKICCNDKVLFDKTIIDSQQVTLEIDCNKVNFLQITHYNKSFGDNNVWHTDGSNECWIQLNDIKFDDVSVGERFINDLEFTTHWTDNQKIMHDAEFFKKYDNFFSDGKLTFNGEINFNFELPIYNWLIIKKYKVPEIKTSYFSNASKLWHYEEQLEMLEEIKQLMNL